jgi:A/G-specific adenine glycosylase
MLLNDVEKLKKWFKARARPLPWRQNATPYAVWVSEIMLQQTQVAVVIPYYLRWMERFPDVLALAQAPAEEVLKLWEGLGYYSRARRLHAGAQQIVREFEGELPRDPALLTQISGIGPYTVGAIRSFAFHERAAAVDGNVLRVLARYDAVTDSIDKASTIDRLRLRAEDFLPQDEPWVAAEALIELGATVCKKQPLCGECPLRNGCQAYTQGAVMDFPKRRTRASVTTLHRLVAIVVSKQRYLVRQVPVGQIMSGLHEFPYLEVESPPQTAQSLLSWVKTLGLSANEVQPLPVVKHSFTRYRAVLYPFLLVCDTTPQHDGYSWHTQSSLAQCAFPSGHRALASYLTGIEADM